MKSPVNPDLSNIEGLPKDFLSILEKTARALGNIRIAIVGGLIRDSFINSNISNSKKSYKFKDIDLVVECSVEEFLKELKSQLNKNRLDSYKLNKAYQTIEIEVDGVCIDIASSRVENYPSPGENPKVILAGLEKDLTRRDFTINAIALELTKKELLDPFNGYKALKEKELIFINSNSVSEDPTRIIRAARYAARLGFNLSKKSLKQIHATINSWPWSWRNGEPESLAPPALSTRLRMELELLFHNEPWEESIKYLKNWNSLLLLDERLQNDNRLIRRLHWATKLKINLLTALIAGCEDSLSIAKRLQIPQKQIILLAQSLEIRELMSEVHLSKEYLDWKPSKWCQTLESSNWEPNSIAIAISLGIPLWEFLMKWWNRWRHTQSNKSAKELLKEGWNPGPNLGKELKNLRYKEIDRLK